jgi:hypothetical protein
MSKFSPTNQAPRPPDPTLVEKVKHKATKNEIRSTAHISITIIDNATGKIFYDNLNSAIEGMQNNGLTVEVQYQISGTTHGAIVLGRSTNG